MKPSFALDLSNERIVLLHRQADGWAPVGMADPAEPDLDDRLHDLRATAETLEPRGFTTKLVIPGSQILYTSVDAPGPDRASRKSQIARALEGRTPYPVEDLVHDWSRIGSDVRVAIVTRLTLAEAEGFAEQYGFRPVAFVARPEDGEFAGEPFFGLTTTAAQHLPAGAKHDRDQDPILEVAPVPVAAPAQAAADTMDEPVHAVAENEAMVDGAPAMEPAPQDVADEAAPVEHPAADAPLPDALPFPEEFEATTPDLPAPVTEASVQDPPEFDEGDVPVPGFTSRRSAMAAPAEPAELTARPSRFGFHDSGGTSAPRIGPAGGIRPPVAPVPPRAAVSAPRIDIPAAASAIASKAAANLPAAGAAMRQAIGTSGNAISRKVRQTVATATVAQATRRAPDVEPSPDRATSLAERAGRPRHFALLLSAALILVMLAVAFWSLWLADDPAADQAAGSVAPAAEPAASEPAPAVSDTAALPAPEQPVEPATATAPASAPDAEAGQTGQASLDAATAAAVEAAIEDSSVSAPAPEPAPAMPDSLPTTVPTVAPPAPPPAGATASDTAASGWVAPEPDSTAPPALALPDPLRLDEMTGLPQAEALPSDTVLAQPADPVPYGNLLRLTPDGLVIATPDGVVTPGGFTLYAGKPQRLPPARPASVATAAAAAQAAAAVSEASPAAPDAAPVATEAAPAGIVPAPSTHPLAGKRPSPRPAGLTPVDQTQAAPETPAAPTAQPVNPAHAALKPRGRPAKIATMVAARDRQAEAIADAAAAAARAEAEARDAAGSRIASASNLAVGSSRRPAERPDGLSAAVTAAIASALATPAATPAVAVASAAPQPEPEPEEIDEPEPVSAAPSIPTRANVAKQATVANALDLGKINLIGVYGSSSSRRALVRMPTGKYVKVKVGDRLDGGKVAAIGDNQLSYVKNGKTVVLKMIKAG